jgi:hypothetical protein
MLLALALLSAALLAYQVVLVHLLSITHWSHFAALVISLALLGFGASGTFLALVRPVVPGREGFAFALFTFLAALSFDPLYRISAAIPFDAFELVAVPRQFLYLSLTYLVLSLPFFLGATAIGIAFMSEPGRIARVYAANLVGSGTGAVLGLVLLGLVPAERLPLAVAVVASLALVPLSRRLVVAPMIFVGVGLLLPGTRIPMSMYKEESMALRLPEAEIRAQADGALGRLRVVESPVLRYMPGASLALEDPVSPRPVLYLNGQPLGLRALEADTALFGLTTTAAGFALPPAVSDPEGERVLLIGLGGGGEVRYARSRGARLIAVVDPDARIDALLAPGTLGDDVVRIARAPRSHLRATSERFDRIVVTEIGSLSGVSSGMSAAGEGYLFTVEGFRDLWQALDEDGVLAITRWVLEPPRDVLRLIATAGDVLGRETPRPADHVAIVRGWGTVTLLVARQPLSATQVNRLRKWSEARWFDVSWAPGVSAAEANRFNLLDRDFYRLGAEALLESTSDPGGRAERFLRTYPFRVAPVTDDAPFFFHFLPLRELSRLWRAEGRLGLPYFEWGLIAQVLTLAQAIPLAGILIILPLLTLARRRMPSPAELAGAARPAATELAGHVRPPATPAAAWLFLYFALLGVAFMLLEVSSIQRLVLFLGHPIYAATVVLTAFLLFAGLGSAAAPAVLSRWGTWTPFAGILVFAALAYVAQIWLLQHASGAALPLRAALACAVLAPLTFCMGMPFPAGLQRVASRRPAWIPWCWGVNGYLSVIAAAAAPLLALQLGFRGVLALAGLLYVFARWVLLRL